MKVAILRSNPVDPDPRVEKIANTLTKIGADVFIIAWNRTLKKKEDYSHKKQVKGVEVIRFDIKASYGSGLKNLIPLIIFQFSLLFWLVKNRKQYDVIHACDFDTVIPAWICKVLFRKKYIYDIFDYYVDAFSVPKSLRTIIERIDTFMINNADYVIITNEARVQQIHKSKPKCIEIIHNSPNLQINSIEKINENLLSRNIKFAYVGILGAGRLLEEIIEVFIENREYELHIGGFGPLDEKIALIAMKHENIHFYGKLDYEDVLKLEENCDVLFAVYDPTVKNHKYSSPNKLYEAMILGKPIIVANDTGIDEIINEHNIGISINYSKYEFERAIKEIVIKIRNNEFNRSKIQNLFQQKYSWSLMEERLIKVYKGLF